MRGWRPKRVDLFSAPSYALMDLIFAMYSRQSYLTVLLNFCVEAICRADEARLLLSARASPTLVSRAGSDAPSSFHKTRKGLPSGLSGTPWISQSRECPHFIRGPPRSISRSTMEKTEATISRLPNISNGARSGSLNPYGFWPLGVRFLSTISPNG